MTWRFDYQIDNVSLEDHADGEHVFSFNCSPSGSSGKKYGGFGFEKALEVMELTPDNVQYRFLVPKLTTYNPNPYNVWLDENGVDRDLIDGDTNDWEDREFRSKSIGKNDLSNVSLVEYVELGKGDFHDFRVMVSQATYSLPHLSDDLGSIEGVDWSGFQRNVIGTFREIFCKAIDERAKLWHRKGGFSNRQVESLRESVKVLN
jgi:hypothetical protein